MSADMASLGYKRDVCMIRLKLFQVLCLVSLSLCMTACIKEDSELQDEDKVTVGDRLPSFSVMLNDGRLFSPDSVKGRILCLTFFNTSCPDCQKELPVVQQTSDLFADSTVCFVCISREENQASVSAYWQRNGLTMPYSVQEDRAVYSLFASSRIPRIYVVDRNQTVRFVFTDNPMATRDELVKAIKSLIE